MKKEVIYNEPLGNVVLCDFCDEDYTIKDDEGGLIFVSKAVCPKCTPRIEADALRFRETGYIVARCPKGKSFADFIREYRGPDAAITITTFR